MIKRLFIMFSALVFLLSGCGPKPQEEDIYHSIIQRDKLIVGVKYDAKPFGFIDKDGKLKGFDVDLARELAKEILGDRNKVEFKQVTPSTRIQAITSGDVDMVIATMTITPQRKAIVDFSDSYYTAGQAIIVPKDSKITSANDLNNKNVIVILGTTGEKNIRYFAPSAVLQGYMNHSDAFDSFKRKMADALTTDDTLLVGFSMDNPGYKILPKRLTSEPYGIAFKKTEGTTALKNNVNRILTNLRYKGVLQDLKEKWHLSQSI